MASDTLLRFACDTGGTFTDLMVEEASGARHMFKAPTTPADPVAGVLDALNRAADSFGVARENLLSRGTQFIHGTTHAINAIITGRTARTAILVTQGHPDILTLRMGGRAAPFDFTVPFPDPIIPRSLTFEVPERVLVDGSIQTPLDEATLRDTCAKLRAVEIEAVAVCLLWSIVNPVHEARVGVILAEELPGLPFTLSHRLNPTIHEFRRASSAALDASLKPLMQRYLSGLQGRLAEAGFAGRLLMVTSQAGMVDAAAAAERPIDVINSGPSLAPVAGRHYAALDMGAATAIIADTGGTTYDVSLVRHGAIPTTRDTWIGPQFSGIMVGFPWVDVKSVGAGGGSIARVDAGGLLRVGPASAGAVPGPVAYGRGGTKPTVTDASVVLGHLDPDFFLGGAMKLDRSAAAEAIRSQIAEPLGLSVEEAANAMLEIATANMVRAIGEITVDQGIDPREAVLVGGGGAAGLNSVRIARRLGCGTLIIPEAGAALSAAGALMSDLKANHRAAFFTRTDRFDTAGGDAVLARLAAECAAFADKSGAPANAVRTRFSAEARYATEVWDIEVELPHARFAEPGAIAACVDAFHTAHRMLFAIDDQSCAVEIVGLSAEVACTLPGQATERAAAPRAASLAPSRRAWFPHLGWVDAALRRFEAMATGEAVVGPALVENAFTTVVIEPGAIARRAPSGSLLVEIGG